MSDRKPQDLIVASFTGENAAREALIKFAAERDNLNGAKELAIVTHSADGRLHMTEQNDLGIGMTAAGGATTGALVGLIGGPIGALIGAATGALIGGVAGRIIDTGIPDDKLREIATSLPAGSSAVVGLVESTAVDGFRRALSAVGGSVMSHGVRDDIHEQVAATQNTAGGAVAAAGAGLSGFGASIGAAAHDAATSAGNTASNLADTAHNTVANAADAAHNAAASATSVASSAVNQAGDAIANVADHTHDAATNAAAQIRTTAANADDALHNMPKPIVDVPVED